MLAYQNVNRAVARRMLGKNRWSFARSICRGQDTEKTGCSSIMYIHKLEHVGVVT